MGGKCKVNWQTVCRPKDLGGLGVLNLDRFARALRLRWLWLQHHLVDAPWAGLDLPCNDADRLLFAAATKIYFGDGSRLSFWHDAWAHGRRPKDIAPAIFLGSGGRKLLVREALHDNRWIRNIDIHAVTSRDHLRQFVDLWSCAQAVVLSEDDTDQITWKFTSDGAYSASSAYRAQFVEHTAMDYENLIWKPWAPPKCKFFAWLIIRNRIWTSDRLAARGWPRNPYCPLCRRSAESVHHLIVECRFSRRIWYAIANLVSLPQLAPRLWPTSASVKEWWIALEGMCGVPTKGVRSLLLLVVWEIWKERNERTFQRKERSAPTLIATIKEEAKLWCIAGAKFLSAIMPSL